MAVQTARRSRRRTGRVVPLAGKSGLPWNSIAFSQNGTANPTTFPTWRGRELDGVVYWPGRSTWVAMRSLPTRRTGDLMVYGIPFWPEGIGGSFAACIAGSYDTEIQ